MFPRVISRQDENANTADDASTTTTAGSSADDDDDETDPTAYLAEFQFAPPHQQGGDSIDFAKWPKNGPEKDYCRLKKTRPMMHHKNFPKRQKRIGPYLELQAGRPRVRDSQPDNAGADEGEGACRLPGDGLEAAVVRGQRG